MSDIGENEQYLEEFLKRTEVKNQKQLIPFDIILLDYRIKAEKRGTKLEDVSGYKVSSFIHNEDQSVPIIVISASDKVLTLLTMRNAGAWDYYLKPGPEANNSENIDFEQESLKKFVNRLQQAAQFSSWARVIQLCNEYSQCLKGKIQDQEFYFDLFETKKNVHHKKWIEITNTISKTLSLVADNLNQFSRLGLNPKSNEEFIEQKAIELNSYLLGLAGESVSTIKEANKQDKQIDNIGKMAYFSRLSMYCRNLVSHEGIPEYIRPNEFLLLQVMATIGLMPEVVTKKLLLPNREMENENSNIPELSQKVIEFADRNRDSQMLFDYRDNSKPLDSLPNLSIKSIFKTLKGCQRTTWLSLVVSMLAILGETQDKQCVDDNDNFSKFYRPLITKIVRNIIYRKIE